MMQGQHRASALGEVLDALWRAAGYCLHPRVIGLSLLPLLVCTVLTLGLGWWFWEDAVAAVRLALDQWALSAALLRWLDAMGLESFRAVMAPLIVVALSVPILLALTLLAVALFMTPALVSLVVRRRFPGMASNLGGGLLKSVLWSFMCTAVALVLMILSVPLWLVPPLVLIVPPLIWGVLTAELLGFDVLAEHASSSERRQIRREHRVASWGMGLVCSYLGAAPSLLWAFSAATLIFAPLLAVVTVWLQTLLFAFAALWFAHHHLAALSSLRTRGAPMSAPKPPPAEPAAPPPALPFQELP